MGVAQRAVRPGQASGSALTASCGGRGRSDWFRAPRGDGRSELLGQRGHLPMQYSTQGLSMRTGHPSTYRRTISHCAINSADKSCPTTSLSLARVVSTSQLASWPRPETLETPAFRPPRHLIFRPPPLPLHPTRRTGAGAPPSRVNKTKRTPASFNFFPPFPSFSPTLLPPCTLPPPTPTNR